MITNILKYLSTLFSNIFTLVALINTVVHNLLCPTSKHTQIFSTLSTLFFNIFTLVALIKAAPWRSLKHWTTREKDATAVCLAVKTGTNAGSEHVRVFLKRRAAAADVEVDLERRHPHVGVGTTLNEQPPELVLLRHRHLQPLVGVVDTRHPPTRQLADRIWNTTFTFLSRSVSLS